MGDTPIPADKPILIGDTLTSLALIENLIEDADLPIDLDIQIVLFDPGTNRVRATLRIDRPDMVPTLQLNTTEDIQSFLDMPKPPGVYVA